MYKTTIVVLLIGFLALAFQATHPPPPNICGSSGGPPITATRIKLRDGRHLAYQEYGVTKEMAKYKFVFFHGHGSGRHGPSVLTPEIAEELGIYLVSFDRPGYGESDPDPKRTLKSTAFDAEELAGQLELGSKFYVIGYSMGGQVVWACLKYIPHRLAGAILIAPVVNYWLPGFPHDLYKEVYRKQLPRDQRALWVAHYIPWLTYWWNTQTWFPASSAITQTLELSPQDMKLLTTLNARQDRPKGNVTQQGEFESLHRDVMVGFGSWEFDPMDLANPFLNNEGSVHLWQGDADWLVPLKLQQYIARRLSWIEYHEVADGGHLFHFADGMMDAILKTLLVGEEKYHTAELGFVTVSNLTSGHG